MGTPSPMQRSEAARQYERLMRQEIKPAEYTRALKEEARADVERLRRKASRRRPTAT